MAMRTQNTQAVGRQHGGSISVDAEEVFQYAYAEEVYQYKGAASVGTAWSSVLCLPSRKLDKIYSVPKELIRKRANLNAEPAASESTILQSSLYA